ncbi:hypothetical protein [Teichococcus vastitatis]|uniref:hypothetical protein n=1 Tax=Teichococcus vastitatis TaxID=2307076 RepID=UPI001F51E912|nr:hypothetical protein [Pseudoroseomonas vastitatis]
MFGTLEDATAHRIRYGGAAASGAGLGPGDGLPRGSRALRLGAGSRTALRLDSGRRALCRIAAHGALRSRISPRVTAWPDRRLLRTGSGTCLRFPGCHGIGADEGQQGKRRGKGENNQMTFPP